MGVVRHDEVRTKKPRILVIGGEATRNFGSKDLHEAFDIELVDKKRTTIPRFKDEDFDAIVVLPWREKKMLELSKKWGAARGIPCFNVRSTGAIRYYLSEQLPKIKKYLDALGKDVKPKQVSRKEEEVEREPSSILWDEDQLWSAYGEPFVQAIRGLDGETCDRKTFIELLEEETGLKGEPVEILTSILRRQGVITEHDGGVVAIGKVMDLDIEKRKKYIEREEKKRGKAFNNGSVSLLNEVREALSEEVDARKGASGISDDTLMGYFAKLSGKTFESSIELFEALGDLGLGRDGKRFSNNWMRMFLFKAEKLGAVRDRTGNRYEFTLFVPEKYLPKAAPTVSIPAARESRPLGLPEVAEPVSQVSPIPKSQGLTSKPFEVAFPHPPSPVPALPPPAQVQPVQDADLAKEGVVYELLEKTYPGKRLPELGGLTAAVRAFRGLFYENQWDFSAARGMLSRLNFQVNEPNLRRTISRKLDFTDDEWSYFALEYLRDQTLFSLLPMIDLTNRIWKICEECQQHFHYNVPRICWGCKERQKGIISEAKGGSGP